MQDYGRGIVVGDDTWGKGTVQTLTNLSDSLILMWSLILRLL